MIIHEGNDSPVEVPIMKASQIETKYVIVKNHVRELPINDEKSSIDNFSDEKQSETQKPVKKRKKTNKHVMRQISSSDSNSDAKATEISENDLQELRTVYKMCKDVIYRMEMRYGHLLDLETGPSRQEKRETDSEEGCDCAVIKKIIFDEDGKQLIKESGLEKHVCPKKLKRRHSDAYTDNRNIHVEYEEPLTLPDDLKSLSIILQDTNIELTYRNKVIDKMRTMKQEFMNEIRFDRLNLVKKLKSDPDEVLDFKGTNLASMPGYPDGKQ